MICCVTWKGKVIRKRISKKHEGVKVSLQLFCVLALDTSSTGPCVHLEERTTSIEWETGWILETLWAFWGTEKSFAPVGNRRIVYIIYVDVVLPLPLPLVCTTSKYSVSDFMHAFSAMIEYIAENGPPNVVSVTLLHHSSMLSCILKIFNFGNMESYILPNKAKKV
jgi:hypothetical protein